jgi:bifunctional non-homologous end joining protein LigD
LDLALSRDCRRRRQTPRFILDGETVVCGPDGVAVFDALHGERRFGEAFLYAFDLIEVDGQDLRHQPFSERKARLATLLPEQHPGGIVINEHVQADGASVFTAACRMGLEGIVSKRIDAPYRSGRSRDWIKRKNPECPAVRRIQGGRW